MRSPVLDPSQAPLPLRGHAIDLVVAGGWRLPVRVGEATVAGDVELEPLAHGAGMPGGVLRCPAALEWRSARGLVRREGELTLRDGRLVLVAADEAVIMQRRNFARVRCAVRVAVVGMGAGEELITRTVDLSVGGMLVEHAALLTIEERVRFSILLPDHGELQGEGEIVRATPFGHRAVQFDPMPRSDEQRLARYVMAQEREGRSSAAYA
ncbi:PilZ domain-containing protein [Paraconexibacter antarcticus]|uniref:PilZ domain-containing protein n=1 Tax=Paraconexibacter antarcticus TaxID=2949664 RepID=A0ABY5DNM6_9ACTN|nr:PilZ domain-containing protein [Paraconexibacter antarcticus]UTI63214.1 PilZ domain-containing protein [Paraconexibacter antarcticus]